MDNNNGELLRRAHHDLAKRARGGIAIYLFAWLIITLPYQYPNKFPWFFYSNVAVLSIILISRILHLIAITKKPDMSISFVNRWLVASILLGGLHWGMVSFWSLINDAYSEISIYLVIAAATLGIAGTITLSISDAIRRIYPATVFGPLIIGLVLNGEIQSIVLATMAGLALIYVFVASKTAGQDYWQSIINQALVEQRAQQMEQLSITDQLTQLKNRSYFDKRLVGEWKRGDRQKTPLSLLMLDLDHFKTLNDTHGHVFGDSCLRLVGEVLRNTIHRETDIVARYGGEEFVILLPDTNAASAKAIAENFRYAIEHMNLEHDGITVDVTCSIGGATIYPDHTIDSEILIKQADDALYMAKRNGRNQYQEYQVTAFSDAPGVINQ